MLEVHLDMPLNLRFIPLSRSLLPDRQKNYDFLIEGRVQYGFSHLNLERQEIMNLQLSPCIDQLYTTKDSHFRPQIADEAISILVAQAIEEMRRSEGFPVLVVAGWHAREQDMHVEMLAAQALARCRTLRDMSEVAQQFGHGSWSLRFYRSPKLQQKPVPNLLFQTYVHDNKPEPASVAKNYVPGVPTTIL